MSTGRDVLCSHLAQARRCLDNRRVKVRQMLDLLKDDGWRLVATRGSHRQLKHAAKPGRVTVSGKLSDDLHPKTQASILRQAGLQR